MRAMTIEYLAGYLDGEGCFFSNKTGAVGVVVENTHVQTLLDIADFWGAGKVTPKNKKKRGRPVFQWRIYGESAVRLADTVSPYLREKVAQAGLLSHIRDSKPRSRLRATLVQQLRDMKKIHHAL